MAAAGRLHKLCFAHSRPSCAVLRPPCSKLASYTAPKSLMSELPVQEDGDTVGFAVARPTGATMGAAFATDSKALLCSGLSSMPNCSQPMLQEGGMLGSRRIVDRESDYSKRRLNRIISPDRNDAFQVGRLGAAGGPARLALSRCPFASCPHPPARSACCCLPDGQQGASRMPGSATHASPALWRRPAASAPNTDPRSCPLGSVLCRQDMA